MRECLNCGMLLDGYIARCPKCDEVIDEQRNPGTCIKRDIGHKGYCIENAMKQFRNLFREARMIRVESVELVTGNGIIKNEVAAKLKAMKTNGEIKDYYKENEGCFKIRL